MDYILRFGKEFLSLTLIVLPWFIIGVAFGALLERYLNPDIAKRFLGKGLPSVINASLLGAILPGCSCATVPMANGLKQSGSSLATVTTFIMVSPLLSPHTLILNYGMLGWEFTIARIIFSLVGAVLLGVIISILASRSMKGFNFPQSLPSAAPACTCGAGCDCGDNSRKSFWQSFKSIFKNLGKYFLLGMILASLMTTLVPEEAIPKYIGTSGPLAYLSSIGIGIPLYVCEGEEIPITLALRDLGFGFGPAFAFLLGSVGTCIPTLMMAPKVIGKRPTVLYFIYWLLFALASGLIFDLIMQ